MWYLHIHVVSIETPGGEARTPQRRIASPLRGSTIAGFTDEDMTDGKKLPDYFNLPVVALVIIVILNDFAIISIAYDHVIPSSIPEKWNLPIVFTVAIWLGMVAVTAQMTLLYILLNGSGGEFFQVSYGHIMGMMWLTVSLLDFFRSVSCCAASPLHTTATADCILGACLRERETPVRGVAVCSRRAWPTDSSSTALSEARCSLLPCSLSLCPRSSA